MDIAFITGITGQDGSYLSEFLLEKGYIVWGLVRRCSNINTTRIDHLIKNKKLILKYGDITDKCNIFSILNEIKKTYDNINKLEIYNLAAMSHVKVSFETPLYTCNTCALGTLNILESIKNLDMIDKCKFYQASTSELYGQVQEIPQTETTQFYPRSPYAVAKLYSYWITKNYREAYGMFNCNGILFNHESPRRGITFVTRKITYGLNLILKNKKDKLVLGNINSKRDWGHAKDFVKGMWLILQQDKPDDYVLATNKSYSIREFIEKAFKLKGFDIKWKGEGLEEVGYDLNTGRELISIDKKYFRPTEVNELLGDYSKAKKILNWEPNINFDELVKEMVNEDCK